MAKEKQLPYQMIVGQTASGMTEKDAESYGRGLIERYFESWKRSYFYVKPKIEEGKKLNKKSCAWYYEIHEGGDGVSYLDSVLARLDALKEERDDAEDPDSVDCAVRLPTGDKVLLIEVDDRKGELIAIQEDLEGYREEMEARGLEEEDRYPWDEHIVSGKKMELYDDSGIKALKISLVLPLVGILSMGVGVGSSILSEPVDLAAMNVPEYALKNVIEMPESKFISHLADDSKRGEKRALVAFKLKDGNWTASYYADYIKEHKKK